MIIAVLCFGANISGFCRSLPALDILLTINKYFKTKEYKTTA
jgi:hypothetical protein